ncbi:hypothetical protein AGLY_007108 [Aphis glycines]|uniref:Uncharacterized protein n=1 Tax=Aphis glycines TaxID=307491 RepID=A0A6G0TNM2_APHGL|nr:hypothetical protein AGLY_007108 [Aphis glycines]
MVIVVNKFQNSLYIQAHQAMRTVTNFINEGPCHFRRRKTNTNFPALRNNNSPSTATNASRHTITCFLSCNIWITSIIIINQLKMVINYTVFQILHYSLSQTIAHYAITVASAPGTGVSPTLPAIFPVIPPVEVHEIICPLLASIPIAPTVPTPPLKNQNMSYFLYRKCTFIYVYYYSLLSNFSCNRFAPRFKKIFQAYSCITRHQIIITDSFKSHFFSKLISTCTHQKNMRSVFHNFSGKCYWMCNVSYTTFMSFPSIIRASISISPFRFNTDPRPALNAGSSSIYSTAT